MINDKPFIHILICSWNTAECEEQIGLNYTNYISCMSNSYGQYVLHQAARQGNLELIKHLHQRGKNAIINGTCDIIKFFGVLTLSVHYSKTPK